MLRLEFYSYSMGIVDNKENEEYIWDRNRMDGRHLMPTYILPVQTWTCPPVGVFVVGCPYRKRVWLALERLFIIYKHDVEENEDEDEVEDD